MTGQNCCGCLPQHGAKPFGHTDSTTGMGRLSLYPHYAAPQIPPGIQELLKGTRSRWRACELQLLEDVVMNVFRLAIALFLVALPSTVGLQAPPYRPMRNR